MRKFYSSLLLLLTVVTSSVSYAQYETVYDCDNVTLHYQEDTENSYAKWADVRGSLREILEGSQFKVMNTKPFRYSFLPEKDGIQVALFFIVEVRNGQNVMEMVAQRFHGEVEVATIRIYKSGPIVSLSSESIIQELKISDRLFGFCF